MVFGANIYRLFAQMLASSTEESEGRDPWVTRMVNLPATVVSTTLEEPLDWPHGTVVSGDAVDVVARLKEESDVPLRSHGSLSMNRALMAAGLVDRLQVTLFPVITGQHGSDPIFQGAADFDLELIENRTLDGNIQELTYRPALQCLSPPRADERIDRQGSDAHDQRPPRGGPDRGRRTVACVRLAIDHPAGRVLVDTGMIDVRPEVDDMSPTPHPENIPRDIACERNRRRERADLLLDRLRQQRDLLVEEVDVGEDRADDDPVLGVEATL